MAEVSSAPRQRVCPHENNVFIACQPQHLGDYPRGFAVDEDIVPARAVSVYGVLIRNLEVSRAGIRPVCQVVGKLCFAPHASALFPFSRYLGEDETANCDGFGRQGDVDAGCARTRQPGRATRLPCGDGQRDNGTELTATRCCAGRRNAAWPGTKSNPASRCRTGWSSVSMAVRATST